MRQDPQETERGVASKREGGEREEGEGEAFPEVLSGLLELNTMSATSSAGR